MQARVVHERGAPSPGSITIGGHRPRHVALPRTRRRAGSPQELTTPLAASFLGLLLVHGMRFAEAAEPASAVAGGSSDPGGGAAGGRPDPGNALPAAAAFAGASADVPLVALGSVLDVGGLIDPAALTRLSGDVRFGGPLPREVGAGGTATPDLPATPAAPAMAAAGSVTLMATMTAATALEPLPEVSGADPTEPDPGPIGDYVV